MVKLNTFVFIFLLLTMLTFVNGEVDDYVKKGNVIELTQSCSNCSYMNLTSIKYPNKTYAFRGDAAMSAVSGEYNYTWSDTETLGIYEWCFEGDVDGQTDVPACLRFEVSNQGFSVNEGQGTIYVFLTIGVFFLFLLTLYFGIGIGGGNKKDYSGKIVGVNYKKYLKMSLLFASYLILIFFFAIGKGMSYSFLSSTEVYSFFTVGFSLLLVGLVPVMMLSITLLIINTIMDKKIQKAIIRGLPMR